MAGGVADCVLISSYRYNNIARECERQNLTTVTTGRELEYSFAVAAGQPELFSMLSKVADLVPDAAVNTALSRYVAQDSKTTIRDFIEENPLFILSAIVLILLVILFLLLKSRKAERKHPN